jgi:hypothetical protein
MSVFVILGGLKLKILQRKALDVIQLAEFSRRSTERNDPAKQVFEFAKVVSDSLKANADYVPRWRWIRRLRIKYLVRVKRLMKELSVQQLSVYALEVFKAEGLNENDLKKKAPKTKQT